MGPLCYLPVHNIYQFQDVPLCDFDVPKNSFTWSGEFNESLFVLLVYSMTKAQ